jgi:hypothetical protein
VTGLVGGLRAEASFWRWLGLASVVDRAARERMIGVHRHARSASPLPAPALGSLPALPTGIVRGRGSRAVMLPAELAAWPMRRSYAARVSQM